VSAGGSFRPPDAPACHHRGVYDFLLILHLLAVVFGIGPMVLNGVYAAKAKKLGPPGQGAVMRVNFDVSMVAEKIIYLIPVFGILLVLEGGDERNLGFDQTWIWLSTLLYVVALGISHGVMVPGAKTMQALGAKFASGQGTPEDGATAAGLEKRLAAGGMTLNLLAIVIIVLMVTQPGR
jgi:uncharacterized membrane protein